MYEHLTDDQVHRLCDVAHELMVEAALQDGGYLRDILLDYVNRLGADELIASISDDPDVVGEHLGFDPDTGEDCDDE
jgi:hypothetical protein